MITSKTSLEEEKEKETLRLSLKITNLASLAREIIKRKGVKELELRSGSRKVEAMMARRLFCQLAVKRLGYYGTEVA